ncbi:MAG: glucose-1-phosphate thymidylyltransferase [Actinomycetota bacterium]|nr:glucose-1-phosphate thymidylyltransferase [Actinomycetota bacterium]
MKGLVLAGGTGSRLRPITYSMAKQLVPVANKPIIEYGLEDLVAAGVTEVGIVISPQTGDDIRTAVRSCSDRIGFNPTFVLQDEPLGLAHALKTALPFVDGDDCLMYLGDNLVKGGVADVVRDFETHHPNCQIMLSPVDNPSSFGVADLAEDGSIRHLVEKPAVPPSNLALVGVYLFDGTISEAVESIEPSARGELEITDAIQYLVDHGRTVRASIVSGWWKDTGTKDDLLAAQHLVIGELDGKIEGEVIDSEVRGEVRVGRGSRIVDSRLVGPVVIGEDVQVTRSTIGPEASIGDGSDIADAAVEASIVMDGSTVLGWKIRSSILGHNTKLHGAGPAGFVEMTLGEQSEVLGD